MIRGDLDSLRRKIVVALVTVDVHARDIVEELKDGAVSSLSDFRWQK
jgi:dynein heavy chain, axonemal